MDGALSAWELLCAGVSLPHAIPPPWEGLEGALISSLQAGHEGGGGRGRAGAQRGPFHPLGAAGAEGPLPKQTALTMAVIINIAAV